MIIAVLFVFAAVESVLVVVFVRSLLELAQSSDSDDAALQDAQETVSASSLAQSSPSSGAPSPVHRWQVHAP